MEGQVSKRRRVYCFEPTKVVQTMFARNYVSHLVPALNKIKSNIPPSREDDDDDNEERSDKIEKIVRYEVDMALAMSTTGFAWSHALRIKLHQQQEDAINVSTKLYTNPSIHVPESKLFQAPQVVSKLKRKKRSELQTKTKWKALKQKHQEEEIGSRLSNLKSLLPGGDQIGVNELFGELKSYITCLELQVNILRCLVESS